MYSRHNCADGQFRHTQFRYSVLHTEYLIISNMIGRNMSYYCKCVKLIFFTYVANTDAAFACRNVYYYPETVII